MKLGIAVSGTGGHIYPGISIAQLAEQKGQKVIFFGNKNDLTQEILKCAGYNVIKINIIGWDRRFFSLLKFLFLFFTAFLKAIYFIVKYKIDIILGMGGYIEIPVIFAAKILGKKTIIHEQNFYPGLANKFLHIICDKTAVGFSSSDKYFKFSKKVFFSGNPIRKEFYNNISKLEAKKYLRISEYKKVIFVFGGSQGAKFINNAILRLLPLISSWNDKLSFIHITGAKDFEIIESEYKKNGFEAIVMKYMPNINWAYFASDLVISRAGASSITELMVVKRPAILIPYPFATENHQYKNALFLKDKGFAIIIEEKKFDLNLFLEKIIELLNIFESISEKLDNTEDYANIKFDENLYKIIEKTFAK